VKFLYEVDSKEREDIIKDSENDGRLFKATKVISRICIE
jgi:hypothetical protein